MKVISVNYSDINEVCLCDGKTRYDSVGVYHAFCGFDRFLLSLILASCHCA